MRIDLNMLQSKNLEESSVPAATIKNDASHVSKPVKGGGVFLDHAQDTILKQDRSKKRSIAEQAEQIDLMGPKAHMDQMIIVSSTMSEQDAKKLSEEGFDLSEMEPGDAVNSLDRMKVRLAEAGVNVAGYTDTVSSREASEILGRTVNLAAQPVIQNDPAVFTATDSGSAILSDPASRVMPDPAAGAITEAAEGFFDKAVTEDEIALTLTAFDLPVTEANTASVMEAVNMASQLGPVGDDVRIYMTDNEMEPTIENLFAAEFSGAGMRRGDAERYVTNDMGYLGKSGNLERTVSTEVPEKAGEDKAAGPYEGIEEQIREIAAEAGYEGDDEVIRDAFDLVNAGVPLTKESIRMYEDTKSIDIRPSKKALMEAIASGQPAKKAYLVRDYNNIKSERILKESALSISTDVNRKLADKEVRLDTSYLEKDVESLKAREKEAFDLLEETLSVRSDILKAPADILGDDRILDALGSMGYGREIPAGQEGTAGDVTLRDIHERIPDHARVYEEAGRTYEAVGTEVRADLGDSIRKAFANTDFKAILEDKGLEDNPINERAVRIIANDHLELTKENIEKIASADRELNSVLDALTPNRVLKMIKNNINPLEMGINELGEKLLMLQDEEHAPVEDFAKYLVSERQKGNITEEEATSYVGIYRLVNAINSGDHSAIGTVLSSGMEMNFTNLLSAVRTSKKAHIDQYIDENFAGIERVAGESTQRIDAMIRTAYSGEDYKEEQYKDEARSFAEAAKADEEIYRMLEEADLPQSARNVNAYEQLMSRGGNPFIQDLMKDTSEKAKERIKDQRDRVLDAMGSGDPEKLKEAYDEMVESELIGAFEGERIDIRALQSREKVINIKKSLAKNENYHIPVEFEGEIININLQIRHGEKRNLVDIYFETDVFGPVHMNLNFEDKVSGRIITGNPSGRDHFKEKLDSIRSAIEEASGKETDLKVGNKEIADDHEAMDGEVRTGSAMLYRTAKAALDAILTL